MNAKDIVYERFIAPLKNKKTGNVGVELEFPLINLNKQPIDISFAKGYFEHLLKTGFECEECDTNGFPAFVVNKYGDVVSFDNSYNNIEFSMNYGDDLNKIADRFYQMYRDASKYFAQKNYIIAGIGSNLYKEYIEQAHVSYPVYNMVDEFLHKYDNDNTHTYPDFPAYLSSVQTHLDVEAEAVPMVADLFAKIDFSMAYIFANSLSFDNTEHLCYRDYLWEKSAFGLLNNNTGSIDVPYENLDGLAKSYLERSLFNRMRNGKYEIFEPVSVEEYYTRDDALATDIHQFLSFRNIEVTARGTVEVRSTCTQPLADAFAPVAFYLGIANNFEYALNIVNEFFEKCGITQKNSELRHMAIKGILPDNISEDALKSFLKSLIDISVSGLQKRSKNEERFVLSLYDRAEALMCPAKMIKQRLSRGESLEAIIKEFSKN